MHSTQPLRYRLLAHRRPLTLSPITPEVIAQGCWAFAYLVISVLCILGAIQGYALIAVPGWEIEALSFTLICMAVTLCMAPNAVVAVYRTLMLGKGRG